MVHANAQIPLVLKVRKSLGFDRINNSNRVRFWFGFIPRRCYFLLLLFSASMYVREWQTRQTNGVHRSVCVYEPRERALTQPDECE